jgi:microcystin-dependent protein
VSTAAAAAVDPSGAAPAAPPSGVGFYEPSSGVSNTQNMAASAVGDAFGGLPHANQMPSLTLNYIIATQGIFPTFGG